MSIVRSIIRSPIRSAIRSVLGASAGSLYGNDMVLVMATTTPDETVTIPCQNVGIFDASIDWGDGSTSAITAYNDADLAHVYADADDHIIRVSKTFPNIYFANGGDKLKLKQVLQLGSTGLTRLNNAFFGCDNITEFRGGVVDTSAVTNMSRMFQNCIRLTTPNVSGFVTSAVTSMSFMFRNCPVLTDAAIDGWDIEAVTSFTEFMTATTIPTARYDDTLVAWDAQNPVDGLSVDFGGSKYTLGSDAATARANLVSNDGWVLSDGGSV